jgi:hypothetical protein
MVIAGGEFVVANLKNQSVPKTPLFFVFELLFRLFVFFGIVCIHSFGASRAKFILRTLAGNITVSENYVHFALCSDQF